MAASTAVPYATSQALTVHQPGIRASFHSLHLMATHLILPARGEPVISAHRYVGRARGKQSGRWGTAGGNGDTWWRTDDLLRAQRLAINV